MDLKIWLAFGLAIMVIVAGILTIILNLKPKGKSIDYYSLFIIGVIWVLAGAAIQNYPFSVLGAIFILVGLVKKREWEQNKKHWNKLNRDERRLVFAMIVILGLLVLAGIYVLLLIKNGTI